MAVGRGALGTSGEGGAARRRRGLRLLFVVTVNLASFATLALLGELAFRLFWNPRYFISCDRWLVGCGQTKAGKKWWPQTTYEIRSAEFRVRFQTNDHGYRARPEPPKSRRPFRVAFVGDSFTEAMQVDYEKTFCALLERGLAGTCPGRELVCENYGVAATGLFDYWHRITHDLLGPEPPGALVLCLYPGNDFSEPYPPTAFDAAGKPLANYFAPPHWAWHAVTWLNLKSRLACYVQQKLVVGYLRYAKPAYDGPPFWWCDPQRAARGAATPAVCRSRALLESITASCRARGTKLCVLIVGPAPFYAEHDGQSPLKRIFADWNLDVPVIDLAAEALALRDQLVFARDGHFNEAGHAYTAIHALEPLRAALGLDEQVVRR